MPHADEPQWCGNQFPHPAHGTCHGVREPGPDITVNFADTEPGDILTIHTSIDRLDSILAWRGGLAPGVALTVGDDTGRRYPATVTGFGSGPTGETVTLKINFGVGRLPGIPAPPHPRPGRAVIPLPGEDLERLLGLPEGMRIVAIGDDFPRCAILLAVESADLPHVEPGAVPPELGGRLSTETKVDADGRLWCRWHWDEEIETLRNRGLA